MLKPGRKLLRDVKQRQFEKVARVAEEQARMWATCSGQSADARKATAESWPICGEVTNIWDGDGPTLVTKGFQSASEPVQIWFPKESSPTGNCFINGEPSLSQSIIPICMERMCDEPSEVWCVECHDPLCHEHVIWINTWEGTPVPYCGACLTAMMNSRSEFFWTVTVSS